MNGYYALILQCEIITSVVDYRTYKYNIRFRFIAKQPQKCYVYNRYFSDKRGLNKWLFVYNVWELFHGINSTDINLKELMLYNNCWF